MADTTEVFDRQPTPTPGRRPGDNRPPMSEFFMLAVGVLVTAIVAIVVFLALLGDDDSSVDTTDTSTTSTTAESTTTDTSVTASTSATSTSGSTTTESTTTVPSTTDSVTTAATDPTTATTAPDQDTYRTAVWPWPDSATRYAEPVEAARGFAVDFVGFTDPVVGEFQQGDSRSGEVEIRPVAGGPVTVVFVRQLDADNTWWVLGSATTNLTLDEPDALSTIESPLTVTGTALAFEGHVDVTLRADGVTEPLVATFATGGGDEPRPFETTLEWSASGADGGAVVLTTSGGEDGRIWEAAVTRVLFADTET